MALITISFKNSSDQDFLVDAGQIKFSMTGNANFPDPNPSLDEIQEGIDEYSAALDNMGNGTGATLIKEEKRAKLEKKLKKLGLYVESAADGNAVIAESSGFKLRDKGSPVGVLAKAYLKVVPGPAKGSLHLSVDKVRGAKMYQFEYKLSSDTSNDSWKIVVNSQTSVVISNLVSGEEYVFRVAGLGTNPTRVYSDEVKSFVL
ncbi:MAG: fibronectin type III domain-containing protein [Daejeonella sp.]